MGGFEAKGEVNLVSGTCTWPRLSGQREIWTKETPGIKQASVRGWNHRQSIMASQTEIIPTVDIARFIYLIRGQRVVLDDDLARLYGVQTFRFNEAVKRNMVRFPADFMFRLSKEEWAAVQVSRARIPILEPTQESPTSDALISQIAMSKKGRGGRRTLPYAFTEHGALMAANILNSPRAVAMSVYVIRAFIRIREELVANATILKRLADIDKTLIIHDVTLREILQKLRPLLEPPPLPPKPEIGFHVKEDAVPYRVVSKRGG